ncbi:hypothetical protein HZS_3718, partial [Henneguya salminicola]
MQQIPPWFEGVKLNYAENLLHQNNNSCGLISESESGRRVTLTHDQIYRETSKLMHQFQRFGFKEGDIIASALPNDDRAVIAMLACASLGCVWTAIPTELQAEGVLQKLVGIKPRILLATDLTVMTIGKFEEKYGHPDDYKRDIAFNRVPFSHPLFILYTSGTTGLSKKLVHSVGGTLIKVAMEHMLHGDLTENDVVFYNTSPGWVMWNWVVTSLFVGGTLLIYDGSPIKPEPYVLWDICDKNWYEKIYVIISATVFGSGAAYYYMMEQKNIVPKNRCSFKNLRYFMSTGSYLPKASYSYLNQQVKKGIPIFSIAAATDIISSFAGHNLTLPVYSGEIQYPTLGMYIQCFDCDGKNVFDQFGELVCIKPFPSMPVFIMNDFDHTRYNDTYFSKYPHIWAQGDYCENNSTTGGIVISGRRYPVIFLTSDSTLNVNGVRIGSSEIYNVVEKIPEVIDSLCVSQDLGNGMERMILFVQHDVIEAYINMI